MGAPLGRYLGGLMARLVRRTPTSEQSLMYTPLALGGITAQPDNAEYEVECWEEEDGVVVADNVDGCESIQYTIVP